MSTLTPDLRQSLFANIAQDQSYLVALYRHLHASPELSMEEEETSARLTAELQQAGLEVTRRVGGNGVVGLLRNGSGPVVMVRADMDALPVTEQTGLAYASTRRTRDDQGNEVGVMHACGHDAHVTIMTGVARELSRRMGTWSGTVVFVGQPAEERMRGARAMLAEGLFTRFPKPDYCLALHVHPALPAGSVGLTEGAGFAHVDSVDILVRGQGGHGAFPQTAKDPVVLAAQLVLGLQTIISREVPPLEPAVLTIGSIHGGTQRNIIPAEVALQVTVRSFSDEVRATMLQAIERVARGLAIAAGLPEGLMPVVSVSEESTSAVWNDPALTRRLEAVFGSLLGKDNALTTKPVMGGEDFALYGRTDERVPICLYWLGAANPERVRAAAQGKEVLPALHSPYFCPDPQPTLQTGVATMTAAVLALLMK